MSNDTIDAVDIRTYTATALKAEQGRRVNNRVKAKKARLEAIAAGLSDDEVKAAVKAAKSRGKGFVLPSLATEQIEALLKGETVTKEFGSGRIVAVSLAD